VPRRPKEENLRLRTLLDEARMSNKGLARRVVDLAANHGVTGVQCDHTSVLRWLAGEQPRSPVPELVATVLSDALGRKVPATELGMTPSNLPGDLGLQLSTEWTDTIATSTALWRADVQRRRFLVNAVFTSAALPASALRWLTSPPADAPAAAGIRRIGHADIDAIRELTHSYREMDNRLGGGKLRNALVSYLDDHVSRLLTTGSYQEETGDSSPPHAASCHNWPAGLPTTVTNTASPSGTSRRHWLTHGTPMTRRSQQKFSLRRHTKRSTWPGPMRRSTSPGPPRPPPLTTVRPPCLLNA